MAEDDAGEGRPLPCVAVFVVLVADAGSEEDNDDTDGGDDADDDDDGENKPSFAHFSLSFSWYSNLLLLSIWVPLFILFAVVMILFKITSDSCRYTQDFFLSRAASRTAEGAYTVGKRDSR